MSDQSMDETERCENCNVAPENFEKGHNYREIERGLEYDVEHLNSLGVLEVNGISLLFDRMNNRLVIQREELSLQEIIEELERKVGTGSDRHE